MPSPLTQNRSPLLAQQALLKAQSSSQSFQTRQLDQADAVSGRQFKERLSANQAQDRLAREIRQSMDSDLLLTSHRRIASDSVQAGKVLAVQKDVAAYVLTQNQRQILQVQMSLGYA